uniref:Ubiquitin-like domain-containing protein n=1 Tax=Strongyloides papillosus TaxID=174720 RepID=A0A0N5BMV6_STREA
MSSTSNASSSNKEKIKIPFRKTMRYHKSKADIKKESDALVQKLRMASMERRTKNSTNDQLPPKKQEKPEEKNMRIFNALYVTPYDDPEMKKKFLNNSSNDSSTSSGDSGKDSMDFFKFIIGKKGTDSKEPVKKNNKVNDKGGAPKKSKSKGVKSKRSSNLLMPLSLPTITNKAESSKKRMEKNILSTSKTQSSSIKSTTRTSIGTPEKIALPPINNGNVNLKTSTSMVTENHSKSEKSNPIPVSVMVLPRPQNVVLTNKSHPIEKDETSIKSVEFEAQLGGVPGKGVPASDSLLKDVLQRINCKKRALDEKSLIRLSLRNAFTNKIQFKFIQPVESTLESLKKRLKNKYNFIGYLFYKGKELVGDDKKLSEFNLPQDCELDITPKITSGDYTRQQYSQMCRSLDQKKQLVKNLNEIIEGLEPSKPKDLTTKRIIAEFETMTESQRKLFDEDMKNKLTKLKEKRDDRRQKKKSFFHKSITDKTSKVKITSLKKKSSTRINNSSKSTK